MREVDLKSVAGRCVYAKELEPACHLCLELVHVQVYAGEVDEADGPAARVRGEGVGHRGGVIARGPAVRRRRGAERDRPRFWAWGGHGRRRGRAAPGSGEGGIARGFVGKRETMLRRISTERRPMRSTPSPPALASTGLERGPRWRRAARLGRISMRIGPCAQRLGQGCRGDGAGPWPPAGRQATAGGLEWRRRVFWSGSLLTGPNFSTAQYAAIFSIEQDSPS